MSEVKRWKLTLLLTHQSTGRAVNAVLVSVSECGLITTHTGSFSSSHPRRLQSALKTSHAAKSYHLNKTVQLTACHCEFNPSAQHFLSTTLVACYKCDFNPLSLQVIVDPGAVPPWASRDSVLYLSPTMMGVKLASQGCYPGTVAGIELTQKLQRSSWRSIKRSRKYKRRIFWGTEDKTGWEKQKDWKEMTQNRWATRRRKETVREMKSSN